MKIRLLGTGAADGIPAMFGDDDVSRYAREHRGKDVRTRSAAILDDHIKIDLPQDTNMQLQRDGLSALDWTALFFTHSDDDHLAVSEIQYALDPFTTLDYLPFTIYGNEVVLSALGCRYPDWPIEMVTTHSFETYRHGEYLVTPIRANHIENEDCHNIIFQKDGKALLYATDTGVWCEETWRFLGGYQLDAVVLECTDGFDPTPYEGHLDVAECIMVVNRLRQSNILKPNAQAVTTHHSVRGMARHCDLEKALLPENIQPGHDGLEIEV